MSPKTNKNPSDKDNANPSTSNTNSVTLTNEQFRELLDSLSLVSQAQKAVTPTVEKFGNFSTCTARFDAELSSSVEAFLDSVLTFKDCACVSDENALRGLPMLLEGTAATWYQGIKSTVSTWQDAVDLLRTTYARKLPPFKIFKQLFSFEQKDMKTELFICNARALIAQLPYTLEERIILDMIYGLLNRRIRERISRDDFNTCNELLVKTRAIESSLDDVLAENPVSSDNLDKPKLSRSKCAYCRTVGHHINECRKKQKQTLKQKTSVTTGEATSSSTKPTITCYGCGTPGVIRSKCSRCNPSNSEVRSSPSNTESFCGIDSKQPPTHKQYRRPVLPVKILGYNGTAIADSGATRSIASQSLYNLMKGHCVFSKQNLSISLADGDETAQEVLTTEIEVVIGYKSIEIEMIVLPNAKPVHTLLGIDFLGKAEVQLNTSCQTWSFDDMPTVQYPYATETRTNDDCTSAATACVSFTSLRQDEGTMLTPDQRRNFDNFLTNHENVFSPGGEPTCLAEHRIVVKPDQVPVSVPPFPMTKAKREILRQQLDQLIADDIIEECESPWAAPVVLVPKKNGEYRLCIDYRRLNEVTVNDKYPMPRIDDLLQSAKPTKFMTTLDLRAGYHQVSVHEADRDKTAFVTPFGMFRWKRMAFGLKNAPATFSRMIDKFKVGLKATIFAYLDDIIVLSQTYEDHLEDLHEVFKRLEHFNLRVNRNKCSFVRQTIRFLGHTITPDGIQADQDKVSAILQWSAPSNLKQLRTFVQTCSWFRKFIPNFSAIARPLTDLTKKSAKWKWETPQEDSFRELKSRLTTAPVLRQADETKPYIIRTDSSDFAVGAVLMQGELHDERPIEYASRLLTSAERNYSTTEREALALVFAVNKFRGYIDGAEEVIVGTDHQPLRWLMSIKTPTGRLARWALQLQSFNLKILYTPGKANVVADTLSRPPISESNIPSEDICPISIDLPKVPQKDLRSSQIADPELATIISDLEAPGESDEARKWSERGYIMEKGILYRYLPDEDKEEAQLVIPIADREAIMNEYHNEISCHDGIERTIHRIKAKYYWPGMRKTIISHVRTCIECQRYKSTNQKPAGLVQTPMPSARFETLSVDFFGPLPETNKGNKWILIVEDTATKWIEVFALKQATALATATVLVEEVFLRYGVPRRIISDNGVQFVSEIMQHVCFCLKISQELTPLYHAESNPVERKNRDLKPRLAILTKTDHSSWDEKLPAIRFAMNTAVCQNTEQTPSYLMFGRELRTAYEVAHDMRQIIETENFVPAVTPYLRRMEAVIQEANEVQMQQHDRNKKYADQKRRMPPDYKQGDLVLLKSHVLSSASHQTTSKLAPKRDGPYVIKRPISKVSYELADFSKPSLSIGKYHVSDITPFCGPSDANIPQPVNPKRKRGRPRKSE